MIEENERRLSVANQGKKQSIVTKLRQQRELSSAKRLAPIYKKIVAQSHLPQSHGSRTPAIEGSNTDFRRNSRMPSSYILSPDERNQLQQKSFEGKFFQSMAQNEVLT